MRFDRIATDSDQMGGPPCIRGLPIPVGTVIDIVADGMAPADINDSSPDLPPEDIEQALRYSAERAKPRAAGRWTVEGEDLEGRVNRSGSVWANQGDLFPRGCL